MIRDITSIERVDWDTPGKRLYHLPFTMDGDWGRVRVPLCVVRGARPGPTIAAIGGTHGDEYEGPVGLKNLINELNPEEMIAGRLIVIPVLNVPAFQVARRDSPLDGGNMNRAFPGDARGSITKRIARFVTDEVLRRADVVLDIHAAGPAMEFARCASFHQIDDPALFAEYRETALLFGMPFVMVYTSGMGTGLLTEEAEAMGKVTIGGEFGYGASADLNGVRWAHYGVRNVMRRYGLLEGPIEVLTPPGLDRQRVVSQTDIDKYVTAPADGIFEPLVALGSFVRAGTPVGRLHDFHRFDEPGLVIPADLDGYVLVRRFRAQTRQGDVVMVIAPEVEA